MTAAAAFTTLLPLPPSRRARPLSPPRPASRHVAPRRPSVRATSVPEPPSTESPATFPSATTPPSSDAASSPSSSQPSDAQSQPPPEYDLMPGEIAVRFINTPSGQTVIAAASVGDNLLKVGDSVNLHIPRGCQTGVCGSCTCDVLDPTSPDGRQTVRACQTGAIPTDGSNELVVDVARMKTASKAKNPMSRFENLDTEYVARAPPKVKGAFTRTVECRECETEGVIECYACDGDGEEEGFICALCAGTGKLRCGDCQGTGMVTIRKR
ncbi:Ferritin-2 [Gracilaria domingensis]|nr:Ferritin-2 [Gracilaria domingensis]